MRLTVIAQIIDETRGIGRDRAALFLLTVDHTKRILLETGLAVLAHLRKMRTEIILQYLIIGRAACRAPDAVDTKLGLL